MQYCYHSPWIGKTFVKFLVLLRSCIFVSKILMKIAATLILLLLAPVTNAVCERSCSSLIRLKTYLRSTMGDERLFYLMVFHVHKQLTNSLDPIQVANQFAANNGSRKQRLGTFSKRGMPMKNVLCETAHKRLSKNNILLLSMKLTANWHFLNFCLLYFLPLSEKFLTVLPFLSPSLHCNFIIIFGYYLHVNHSQHDLHKPLSQVLPQRTSLKFPLKFNLRLF